MSNFTLGAHAHGLWVDGAQPHTVLQCTEPVDTSLHVLYTKTSVHMCAVDENVSVSKPFFVYRVCIHQGT